MPTIEVLNQAGSKVKDITLSDGVFGIEPNQQVIYDVVKAQRAALRQGTHKTKTRTEVSGGGAKPWRQKGTGRARQGSTRSPQWVGGGVVFGPTPRDYGVKVNRKVRRLALKSVLSAKVSDNELVVLDDITLDTFKTKEMVEILRNLKVEGKALIVLPERNEFIERATRNIAGVSVANLEHTSVYDLLRFGCVITTEAGIAKYEEVLG